MEIVEYCNNTDSEAETGNQDMVSSLEQHRVYKIILGRVLTGEGELVKDVVAIGLQNLTEGAKNPLSEYNAAFRRLQMRRRMTPVTDLPTGTPQSPGPANPPQFEAAIITEDVDLPGPEIGASILVHPTLDSAAENTNKLPLTEDTSFIEPEDAEENVESLAGMLDDLYKQYNGETLPRLSELDVAFDMDEEEILDEEPWDDNDSDSDAEIDSGASEDERE